MSGLNFIFKFSFRMQLETSLFLFAQDIQSNYSHIELLCHRGLFNQNFMAQISFTQILMVKININ